MNQDKFMEWFKSAYPQDVDFLHHDLDFSLDELREAFEAGYKSFVLKLEKEPFVRIEN